MELNIIKNLVEKGKKFYIVDDSYLMTRQNGMIQWHMRCMLVDWMQEVCDEFALTRETFHLSLSYVDIYLTRKLCPIEKLQLLGASSLMLACKIEEIVCPRVAHFSYATDNGFTN